MARLQRLASSSSRCYTRLPDAPGLRDDGLILCVLRLYTTYPRQSNSIGLPLRFFVDHISIFFSHLFRYFVLFREIHIGSHFRICILPFSTRLDAVNSRERRRLSADLSQRPHCGSFRMTKDGFFPNDVVDHCFVVARHVALRPTAVSGWPTV